MDFGLSRLMAFSNARVTDLLWNLEVPFAAREACIRSMCHLFPDMFAFEPLKSGSFMWWDSLCWHLWHRGKKDRLRGGEELSIQDVMFETLVEILALDSDACQLAALHGLGHLHHPATAEVIQRYIARHPMLSDERRDYALAAAQFDVQ